MNSSERSARLRANLGIEPISHGQIYTFQIAIPESEKENTSPEKRLLIEESLTQHKSNLIPLIVRRTEAYTEEEEYEVVYGADWCLVAKEIDIEKLWVWVFDMTDDQAAAAKQEMQQLVYSSSSGEKTGEEETDIGSLVEQKLRPIYAKLNQLISNPPGKAVKQDDDEKLSGIESQLKTLETLLSTVYPKIERIIQIIDPPKLNLLEAKEEDIKSALQKKGATDNQIKAALEAIKYWRESGKGLTLPNLKKSTESKSKEHKIKNFGKGAYEKLKEVADTQ